MIEPFNRNILIKEEEFKDRTESGLLLTTTTSETPSMGIVVAKALDRILPFNLGDVVLYPKFFGVKVTIENQEYLVVGEGDLLGKKRI